MRAALIFCFSVICGRGGSSCIRWRSGEKIPEAAAEVATAIWPQKKGINFCPGVTPGFAVAVRPPSERPGPFQFAPNRGQVL